MSRHARDLLLAMLLLWPARAGADLELTDAEARLRDAWHALHPGQPSPARCHHPDPVRTLRADVDDAPGVETAVASLRWGVVLLDAAGKPLGALALGCGAANDSHGAPEVLGFTILGATGQPHHELVVRTRAIAHCGRIDSFSIVRRRGRSLFVALEVEEDYAGYCGGGPPSKRRSSVSVLGPDRIQVTRASERGDATVYRAGSDGKFVPEKN